MKVMGVKPVAIVLPEESLSAIHWPANGLLGVSTEFTVSDTVVGGNGAVTVIVATCAFSLSPNESVTVTPTT